MKNTFVWALLACAALYGTISQAASYEEIVVAGTRTPVEAGRLPAAVTVINRQDIEELQVNSLPELLRGVAGIDVTVGGGYGKITGVRIRGAESDHVLGVDRWGQRRVGNCGNYRVRISAACTGRTH